MQQKVDKISISHALKGGVIGIVILILCVLISVVLILKANLNEQFYMPILLLCVLFSGLISGYVSSRKTRNNGLLHGSMAAVLPSLVLLVATSVAGKSFDAVSFIPISVMIVFGAMGGIMAVNLRIKKKKR